jgi:hypothetical protein
MATAPLKPTHFIRSLKGVTRSGPNSITGNLVKFSRRTYFSKALKSSSNPEQDDLLRFQLLYQSAGSNSRDNRSKSD